MIAKLLTVFMGPLNLDARRVNRRATNRHPESSGEAGSEGSKSGALAPIFLSGATVTQPSRLDLSYAPQNRRVSNRHPELTVVTP